MNARSMPRACSSCAAIAFSVRGEVGELVVGMATEVDARREVAGRHGPRGVAHRRERPGEPAGEEHRDDDRDADRDQRGDQEEAPRLAGRVLVDLLGEQEHRRAVGAGGERLGDEHDAAGAPDLVLSGEQRLGVEVVDAQPVGELEQRRVAGLANTTLLSPTSPSVTSPSG